MSCENKLSFPGRNSAKRHARKSSSKYGAKMRHYFCPDCSGWHVSSKEPFKRLKDSAPELFKKSFDKTAKSTANSLRGTQPKKNATIKDILKLAEDMRK